MRAASVHMRTKGWPDGLHLAPQAPARRAAFILFLVGVLGLLVIQLIPYGREHSNPAVVSEPPWDSPATRAFAVTACFDCHSNETEWPWYSNIAPMSWLVQRDVDEGRQHLNFHVGCAHCAWRRH